MLKKLEVVTVKIKWSRRWIPTIYDVNKCCDTSGFYNHTLQIADYKSGKSLKNKNDDHNSVAKSNGVYIVDVSYDFGEKIYFYNYYGEYIWVCNYGYIYVTLIKPKKYKNLCIGLSGDTRLKLSSKDKKYFKGKTNFKNTSWNSRPNNTKWVRIK